MKKLIILLLVLFAVSSCTPRYGALEPGQTVNEWIASKSLEELLELNKQIRADNARYRQTDYQTLMLEIDTIIKDYKYKGE